MAKTKTKLVATANVKNNVAFHSFLVNRKNATPYTLPNQERPFLYKIPLRVPFYALANLKDLPNGETEVELNLSCHSGIVNRFKTIAHTPEQFLLALNNFERELRKCKEYILDEVHQIFISEVGIKLIRQSLRRTGHATLPGIPASIFFLEDDSPDTITGVRALPMREYTLAEKLYEGKPLYYTVIKDRKAPKIDKFVARSADTMYMPSKQLIAVAQGLSIQSLSKEVAACISDIQKSRPVPIRNIQAMLAVKESLSGENNPITEWAVKASASYEARCSEIPKSNVYTRVGVVGFSGQQFDRHKANECLMDAMSKIKGPAVIISGLTDIGVPALAYRVAKQFKFKTAGIACEKAKEYPNYPVDVSPIIVGKEWGDESHTFLNNLDMLIRVGGGQQSLREVNEAKAKGIPVIEYNL